ncbi:MAG TPA: cation-transporting P-type ATPase [Gaiellaceae bacterium]|nr:cation-transporting P-type ATPase [Gaiellaceae bacterium]
MWLFHIHPQRAVGQADAVSGKPPHALAAELVVDELGTDVRRGLSEEEATGRLERIGPNELAVRERPNYVAVALRQLADPLVALLAAAAAVSAGIGQGIEAVVIAAIVALNFCLGFIQEVRAEHAVLALRKAVDLQAVVVRGGSEHVVPARVLVPGDVILLEAGDRVPADARLAAATGLAVDESALTGESVPVDKGVEAIDLGAALAERTSLVFAGTAVTRGRARAIVLSTGAAMEIGRIAALASAAKPPPTPLQRRLARLSRRLALAGGVLTVVLATAMVAQGETLQDSFLVGVAVAVAAVPEGLGAVVTIALAQGATAMARRGAIVRRLAAIETLGETTVIATDKTGTLTLNELHVAAVEAAYERKPHEVLAAGALASTAGDPIDTALVRAAREAGLEPDDADERLDEIPFDALRRRVTVLYSHPSGAGRLVVKGAPEAVLPRCDLSATDAERFDRLAEEWGRRGLRILAVAERELTQHVGSLEQAEESLATVGLVGLHDPVRPAVPAAVETAHGAGIDVVMVTGDHPTTAEAVARELGIQDGAAEPKVLARVEPVDKLRLVERLQSRGEIVAVTGDGINDAPALRRADVGISMGRSGTEAAREASDVVLTDDDFSTIVAAIREGRRIGDNLRTFLAFLLSANAGEVVLFAVAVLAGLGAPMTVVQVLAVNLLTDGLPAIALARDPASADTMRRPPAHLGTLLGRELTLALVAAGLGVGLAATGAYLVGREVDPGAAQTMAFATIALAELVLVFAVRTPHRPAWRGSRNETLMVAVIGSVLVVAAAIYVPLGRELTGTEALGPFELGVVLALAVAPAALVEVAKAARRLRAR